MRKPKTTQMKKQTEYPQISFRVSQTEKENVEAFAKKIQQLNPFMSTSDVLRELCSISDHGVISQQMRDELSGKSERKSGDDVEIESIKRVQRNEQKEA